MLAGIVFSGVTGGSLAAVVSVLSGHHPALTLLFYSLAGCCGVLAYLWQALETERRAKRA